MDRDSLCEVYNSIARHLEESQRICIETGSSTAPTPGTSAKIAFEAVSIDYLDALQDLKHKIGDSLRASRSSAVQELECLSLPSPNLLWMVPAFCCCSQFLDPVDCLEICVAIQKTRSAREANFTDDIWDKALVHDWAGSDDSRLLLLQGNSQTTKRFERFTVEIIQALKSNQPGQPVRLVYVLHTPRPRGSSSPLAPSDLLQQVAVQCLQCVGSGSVGFLAEIVHRFNAATNSQDWFGILQDICILIPSLYIIIDLAILGRNYEETQSWPACIQDLFNYLKASRRGCRLKVMLLSCRKFTSQEGETLFFNAPPISSKPDQTRKQIHQVVADPEGRAFARNDGKVYPMPQKAFPGSQSPSPSVGTVSSQAFSTTPDEPSESNHLHNSSPCLSEPRHRGDFKVAIICALPLESDAVQDMLDKRWDEVKYEKMPGDPNHYTTGVIGRHNVVVVHMPGMGKSNGASVAANCRASFINLGLVLVVGICGGVPFAKNGAEIVLGDVIISDGLIQYDFGRQFPDRFVRKHDTMARLSSDVLSFLAKMKGRWNMKNLRQRTAMHLEYLRNESELAGIADYPGARRDKLYEPTYRHKHQSASTCEVCNACQTKNDRVCEDALTLDCSSLQCDDRHLVTRNRLVAQADEQNQKATGNTEPLIHFGLYASGDKVMKSGEEREIIAMEEGVIAFEMEGAGVWEAFPGRCLVVKGVCDYADSHKNKRWQTYAAASAAACTKALLESW